MKTDIIRTGVGSMRYMAPPALRGGLQPFEACIKSLVDADRNGYHWVVCHDATDWPTPSSAWNEKLSDFCKDAPDPNGVFAMDVAIGAAAAQTERIRFLWGPLDLVRRAPVNIAQSVLTLDHATRGRMAVMLSQGQQNHMRQYGTARAGTKDKLWDGVQIVTKLIRQNHAFSYRGRVWRFDNGGLALPPYGAQPPEVFIAGGFEESLELAGRFADGWVDCPPGLDMNDPEVFRRKVSSVRRHAAAVGRDPDALTILVLICVTMMEDENLIEAAIDHPIVRWNTLCGTDSSYFYKWGLTHPYGADWTYFRDCIPEWISAEEFYDVCARTPREAVGKAQFLGTSASVFKQLQPWLDCGITDVLVYNTAAMVSVAHMKSAQEANAKLLAKLKGRAVSRAALAA
jgi:phthiodiolone/phenolphthiodiolone dimycocerosates ketoreductase